MHICLVCDFARIGWRCRQQIPAIYVFFVPALAIILQIHEISKTLFGNRTGHAWHRLPVL